MGVYLISISHKVAPLRIRELFAFPEERQAELMRAVVEQGIAGECVIISTCNRTELYAYAEQPVKIFSKMQDILLKFAHAEEEENIGSYVRLYGGSKAVRHLFQVAAGLDSMVMGEDQILGQVKRAHDFARESGTCGVYLNTLFRYAVTASKKVKTETELSRTTVSMATMAVKAAEQELGHLTGKKVMLIGASGKIGGIVLKNLQCIEGVQVCITARNMNLAREDKHHRITYQVMDYERRYELMDEMDVIISATSSPHYTLTFEKLQKSLRTEKPRVLVDLAVPIDIEARASEIPGVKRYDVDDFQELAKANNEKKQAEIIAADQILEECQLDFERWMVFQQSLPQMAELKRWMLAEAEKKGFERAIDKFFYRLRDASDPKDLKAFFQQIKEI